MTTAPLYDALFQDPAIDALMTAEAELSTMIAVEAAVARAQASLGLIPAEAGGALAEALRRCVVSRGAVSEGAAAAGVVVPALIAALRAQLPEHLAEWLHWGVTSQDVVDTALILRLRDALEIVERSLVAVGDRLAALADAHRRTPMVGRTRHQHATPIVFGIRAAAWLGPTTRLLDRARDLRRRALAAQLGGASGDLSVFGDRGGDLIDAFAAELGLAAAPPWHAQRDRLVELGDWFAASATAMGRIGQDLILSAQSDVSEIRLAAAGGSSTMPQKQNPVGPEAMVALARMAANDVAATHHAALHAHERDGAAWMSEWLALPRIVCAAGGATRLAATVLAGAEPVPERMRRTLEAARELPLAEAASFTLAPSMGRVAAQALVKRVALATAATEDRLLDALTEAGADGAALAPLRDDAPGRSADAVIDRALGEYRAARPTNA